MANRKNGRFLLVKWWQMPFQIFCSRSLRQYRINYKFRVSVRLLTIKISHWAREDFCSYYKMVYCPTVECGLSFFFSTLTSFMSRREVQAKYMLLQSSGIKVVDKGRITFKKSLHSWRFPSGSTSSKRIRLALFSLTKDESNQIKLFKLDNARSSYPVSRARG